jgi:XTP/dITP diphosphohydrolase
MRKQMLLATNNKGKIVELQKILGFLSGIELISPSELGLDLEVEESGSTYLENAQLKAEAFCKASGIISLADDSGLEVDALNSAPGLYSARFSPKKGANDKDRRNHLLEVLLENDRPWKAHFTATVVVAIPEKSPIIGVGECYGEIVPEEIGEGGFGYDPIFLISELGKTMAELDSDTKNRISHRGKAVHSIMQQLKELFELE